MTTTTRMSTLYGYHSPQKIDQLLNEARQELVSLDKEQNIDVANEEWLSQLLHSYVQHSTKARIAQVRAMLQLQTEPVTDFTAHKTLVVTDVDALLQPLRARVAETETEPACLRTLQRRRQCLMSAWERVIEQSVYGAAQTVGRVQRALDKQKDLHDRALKKLITEHHKRLTYLKQTTNTNVDTNDLAVRDQKHYEQAREGVNKALQAFRKTLEAQEQDDAISDQSRLLSVLTDELLRFKTAPPCKLAPAVQALADAEFVTTFGATFDNKLTDTRSKATALQC